MFAMFPKDQLFVFLLVSTLCLVTCQAAVDLGLCNFTGDGGPSPVVPVFEDNFHLFAEEKSKVDNAIVHIGDINLSQKEGREFIEYQSKEKTSKIWVNAAYDHYLQVDIHPARDNCSLKSLQNGGNKDEVIVDPITQSISIGSPAAVLHFDDGNNLGNPVYAGRELLEDRGMEVDVWKTCSYDKASDLTSAMTWRFNDPTNIRMPSKNASLLLTMDIEAKLSTLSKIWRYRFDYTQHTFNINPSHDPRFEIPVDLYCAKARLQQTMPTIPDHFRFKGEQVEHLNGFTTLSYFQETFNRQLGLYIAENEKVPDNEDSPNDVSYIVSVSDFNTGLYHVVDEMAGSCQTTAIPTDDTGAFTLADGNVAMRTSSQYFDLDAKTYHYMGLHRMTDRGIDADVYTNRFKMNDSISTRRGALYSWYFADKNWKKSMRYREGVNIPVSLSVEKTENGVPITARFNIFEYSTQLDRQLPDVSLCHGVSGAIPVQLYFNGRYDHVVSPDPFAFQSAFLAQVKDAANIKSPLRVARIDVQPTSLTQFLVRFLLLDKSKVKGDVDRPQIELTAKEAYTLLTEVVDKGHFTLNVKRGRGNGGTIKISAKPDGVGTYKSGKFKDEKDKKPYAAGDMVALGICMLLIGLLISVICVYFFIKARKGPVSERIEKIKAHKDPVSERIEKIEFSSEAY